MSNRDRRQIEKAIFFVDWAIFAAVLMQVAFYFGDPTLALSLLGTSMAAALTGVRIRMGVD